MWKVVYYLTPSSFCFGVERSIKELNSIIKSHPWDKVFCIHALVHNPKVTESFEHKHVVFVESIDEVSDSNAIIVFSAHGINRVVLDEAKKRFKAVYNLECPFVTKIYNEIDLFVSNGVKTFFYIGKKHHQEGKNVIEYIKSKWCEVFAFQTGDAIPHIDTSKQIAVLSQTTLNFSYVKDILDQIQSMYSNIILPSPSDVCKATYERQTIVTDNLDKFDAFIVIGGKESNNSRELYNIGIKYGKKTFYGENLADILQYPKEELFACDTVAVTGGASTPAEDIQAVFDFYRKNWYEPKMLSL